MLYLSNFNPLRFFKMETSWAWALGCLIFLAWLFLLLDFTRQLSLFFPEKEK